VYSETELRDALRASATRFTDLPPTSDRISPLTRPAGRPPRRRWSTIALPIAAAASVAAAATIAVVVSQGSHQTAAQPSATPRASASPRHPASPLHVAVDVTSLVDAVQADSRVQPDRWIDYQVSPGYQTISRPLAGRSNLTVTVVSRSKSGFDPARLPRNHPIQIAGTTGYYALFKLLPLDGSPDAGKNPARWTIGFPAKNDNWVFVNYSTGAANETEAGTDDPAAITAAYNAAHVRLVAGTSRVPFRTGWLPAGLRVQNLDLDTHPGHPTTVDLTLTDGRGYLFISAADAAQPPIVTDCTADLPSQSNRRIKPTPHCRPVPTRVANGLRVEVTGQHLDNATLHHVLDTITIARDAADPSTYWTLNGALG
jgi:hypothetical protein